MSDLVVNQNEFGKQVPNGQSFLYGSSEFDAAETIGLKVAAKTAFVLVAGGLGERLG